MRVHLTNVDLNACFIYYYFWLSGNQSSLTLNFLQTVIINTVINQKALVHVKFYLTANGTHLCYKLSSGYLVN